MKWIWILHFILIGQEYEYYDAKYLTAFSCTDFDETVYY
jgi:hypothetical protein